MTTYGERPFRTIATGMRVASAEDYRTMLGRARARSAQIANATSAPDEMPSDAVYLASSDGTRGLGIMPDGTLIGLYSTVRGSGDALVRTAVAHGAVALDCFDGYLPTLYARHGFRETRREANWTPGAPDVVYMALV